MTTLLNSTFIKKVIQTANNVEPLIKIHGNIQDFQKFVGFFFRHISARHLQNLTKSSGYNLLAIRSIHAWNLLQNNLSAHQPTIEFFFFKSPQSNVTVLTILNHDRPFLVDTTQLSCKRNDIVCSDIIHPVIPLATLIPNKSDVYLSIISVLIEDTLDETGLQTLQNALEEGFRDLYLATEDHTTMNELIHKAANDFKKYPLMLQDLSSKDVANFIHWLSEDRWTVLGARTFDGGISKNFGIFKLPFYQNHTQLDSFYFNALGQKPSMIYLLHKTSLRAIVHHYARIVIIEIPILDENGFIRGVYQFIGILNRLFYRESPHTIPILKKKMARIYNAYHLKPQWHNAKEIQLILSSVPNDELLLLEEQTLYDLCSDLLFSEEHISLLIRYDPVAMTAALQIFIPKDWYTYQVPSKIINYLIAHYAITISNHNVLLGELPYVRLIIIANIENKTNPLIIEELREPITQIVMNWEEQLSTLIEHQLHTYLKIDNVFPATYQGSFKPKEALEDLLILERTYLENQTNFHLFLYENSLFIKIFQKDQAVSLSAIMPVLENFGLYVYSEASYKIAYKGEICWIHGMTCQKPVYLMRHHLETLKEALGVVWSKHVENNAFNQFVILSDLNIKQVNVLRALDKALQQMQSYYSTLYTIEVLKTYPRLTRYLWELFEERFNPNKQQKESIFEKLEQELQEVKRSDHDKIYRRFINVITSMLRTNYYQQPEKDYIAFKFDSNTLQDIPLPKPFVEIFVYAPYMKGCHLRGGPIARGGIRWSDRPEDFRNETLDLMKAQSVKNSVIVPTGSKGGFVCDRYQSLKDQGVTKEKLHNEVIHCYQTLIRGMLDLSDNLVNRKIQRPRDTICYDGHDPYLVVAADKGTSTFSDIANQLAREYNFWLDDAFASGGSKGYDHKKMAITSRGAWISIRHHFQQINIDPEKDPITVVGVGDMSGDVFGNGMLRSATMKLVAAFNHTHIFIDPNPHPQKSFEERLRLFQMVGSSWDDYNRSLISAGGGIYSRSEKNVLISPEAKKILNLDGTINKLNPDDFIMAILKAPVDLLWFGGIGTYIKASTEGHMDAKDRHNDHVRINARELRAQVIGEGANLAMTQKARIEYALAGGRLNSDAIDNSAGVDCSDHEVNVKILFSQAIETGRLSLQQRDALLFSMTDDMAYLILEDNRQQNEVLSLMERENQQFYAAYLRVIQILENDPVVPLNRIVEYIPDHHTLEQRFAKGHGLTRPELSIFLAYSKNILKYQLIKHLQGHEFPDLLLGYFPKILQEKFKDLILNHPLHQEILATRMSNLIMNTLGPSFIFETSELLTITPSQLTCYYFDMEQILKSHSLWGHLQENIPELRNTVSLGAISLLNVQDGFSPEVTLKAKNLLNAFTLSDFSPINLAAILKISQENHVSNAEQLPHNLIKSCFELGFDRLSNHLKNYHYKTPWQREILADLQSRLIASLTQITLKVTTMGGFHEWQKNWIHEINILHHSLLALEGWTNETSKIDLSYIMYLTNHIEHLISRA